MIILIGMEPEKFLTLTEFNALLKTANGDRESCILLLLAGVGLRVGEMTQIRAEDIDFNKGYLHVQAVNAKFRKPRTVVLLPRVIDALKKLLKNRSKGWLFPGYREGHISSRQVQNILGGVATRAGLQEVKRQDKAGKNRHRVHPHLLRHSFAVWSLDSGVPSAVFRPMAETMVQLNANNIKINIIFVPKSRIIAHPPLN